VGDRFKCGAYDSGFFFMIIDNLNNIHRIPCDLLAMYMDSDTC
jgi:hypothetical protein